MTQLGRAQLNSKGKGRVGGRGGVGMPSANWKRGGLGHSKQQACKSGTDHTAIEGLGGGCALVLDPGVLQGLVGCQPLCWLPNQQTLQSPPDESQLLSMQSAQQWSSSGPAVIQRWSSSG